jgi:hypothetical protein
MPGTIRKVEKRVLKGFSVGIINGRVIKSAKAPNGVIDDGVVAEVSLVDRPCNPTAMMSIAKSAGGPTLEPVEVEAEDAPTIIDDPNPAEPTSPEVIEKSAGWYRESLRLVEDTLAGRWSHTVAFISKAAAAASDGDQAEVTGAYAAMDQILDLIIAEAGQAKGGRVKELRDIEVLLSACRSLCCFIECEQDEGMTGEVNDGDIDMAYMAEDTYAKAFGIWGADDEAVRSRLDKGTASTAVRRGVRRAPTEPESTAGDEADAAATVEAATAEIITKAVAAAQAESAQAHEAELATLRAQLEKAQAAPLTGGPVTFSTVLKTSSAPGQTVPPGRFRALAQARRGPQPVPRRAPRVHRQGRQPEPRSLHIGGIPCPRASPTCSTTFSTTWRASPPRRPTG